jgi:hypothetical protein
MHIIYNLLQIKLACIGQLDLLVYDRKIES